MLPLTRCIKNKRAQATAELAIMGSVILMALLFLAQQGFNYNLQQGLEMYAFRQALRMSKQDLRRSVDLTVMRELPTPSLFAGISRQRAMASASVGLNPYDLWVAEEDTPQDIPTYQLIQMNEGMIKNGYFVKVPVTKIKVTETDNEDPEWSWTTSGIKEFDSQVVGSHKTSDYTYTDYAAQRDRSHGNRNNYAKHLTSHDTSGMVVRLEGKQTKPNGENEIVYDYKENDWEGKLVNVEVDTTTLPKDVRIVLDEHLGKYKSVTTPQ